MNILSLNARDRRYIHEMGQTSYDNKYALRMFKEGNNAEIIRMLLNSTRTLALKYHQFMPNCPVPDLIGEGLLAFPIIKKNFDPSYDQRLLYYSVNPIRQSMKRAMLKTSFPIGLPTGGYPVWKKMFDTDWEKKYEDFEQKYSYDQKLNFENHHRDVRTDLMERFIEAVEPYFDDPKLVEILKYKYVKDLNMKETGRAMKISREYVRQLLERIHRKLNLIFRILKYDSSLPFENCIYLLENLNRKKTNFKIKIKNLRKGLSFAALLIKQKQHLFDVRTQTTKRYSLTLSITDLIQIRYRIRHRYKLNCYLSDLFKKYLPRLEVKEKQSLLLSQINSGSHSGS